MRASLLVCPLALFIAAQAAAAEAPQIELAPLVGVQFFRGINGPGWGQDQGLQNSMVVGGRAGAVFEDRMHLELGLEYTPTMAVGIDEFTHVGQAHFDLTLDLTTGWIRPYLGAGVGVIGFSSNDWLGEIPNRVTQEPSVADRPDTEFTAAVMGGVRMSMGHFVDLLQGSSLRLDLRDVIYAPRNSVKDYMQDPPGGLTAFHNLQVSLAMSWTFDSYGGASSEGDYYEGKGGFGM